KPNNTALVIDQGVFSFDRPDGADFGLHVYDPSPDSGTLVGDIYVNGNLIQSVPVTDACGDGLLLVRFEVTDISGFTTGASANFRVLVDGTQIYNQTLRGMDLSSNYVQLDALGVLITVEYLEVSAISVMTPPLEIVTIPGTANIFG